MAGELKKVITVDVYQGKNVVKNYGFMAGDKNTPVMEVTFKDTFGTENLEGYFLRYILIDNAGSLIADEVVIDSGNKAVVTLPNELFEASRKIKVQLAIVSADDEQVANINYFVDSEIRKGLAEDDFVEPVYQLLLDKMLAAGSGVYKEITKLSSDTLSAILTQAAIVKGSLEQYLITADNGGNAEFLQGHSPVNFNRVEPTISALINSAWSKYKVGDVVEVLGYYVAGDGAGHKRKIASANDGSGVQLANGLWANIVHSGEVNVSWFGAKGDFEYENFIGTDSSENFKKALEYCDKKYSTTLVVDGNYYIAETITTTNIIMRGHSVPCRYMLNNDNNSTVEFNSQSSSIAVAEGVVAFSLEGYGTAQQRDARIHLEKIKFFGKRKSSTFIHAKIFGAPARPLVVRDCEGEGLKDFLLIENPSIDSLGTNFYSSDFSNNNFYYCENFINTINPSNNQGFGGFSIKDSVVEQGCKIKIENVMGYGEIKNCLLEGTPNVFDIMLHADASLSIEGCYFEKNTGVNYISSAVGGQRNSLNFSYCYDLNSTHTFNISNLKVRMLGNKASGNCKFRFVEFTEKDFVLKSEQIDNAVYYKNGAVLESMPDGYWDKFKIGPAFTHTIDGIKVRSVAIGSNVQANRNINGVQVGDYITAQFYNAGNKFNCNVQFIDLSGSGGYTEVSTITVPARSFVTIRKRLLKNVSGTSIGLYLGGVTADTFLSGGYYAINAELDTDFLCARDTDMTSSFTTLDTPYYTTKMQSEGIYEDYITYRDELHAYEQEQKLIEQQRQEAYQRALEENPELSYDDWLSAQLMQMSIQREPVPSKELIAFKEKYLG